MKRLPELIDEERDRLQAQKLEQVTREAETYWNETGPCGALPVKPFTLGDGVELLLYDGRAEFLRNDVKAAHHRLFG